MTLDEQILTGLTESHLAAYEGAKVHKGAVRALGFLAKELKQNGFELGIASSFRGFESQLKIWNAKALGQRTLLDANSNALDFLKLSPTEIIHAILRWSALPGLSRHHWGTDFDVYDKLSLPDGYKIQLVPSEFENNGYFSKMHDWLDQNMRRFGFFRPYQKDLGGVSPERWHISYLPLAENFIQMHSVDLEERALQNAKVELYSDLIKDLPVLFKRYFLNITTP